MSRAETLIAAIAKNATYVANLDAAAKKKPLTAKQKASRASAVEKFDTYVLEYANLLAGTPTAPPVTPTTPTPTVPGDAAAKSKAWDHDAAAAEINRILLESGVTDPDAQLAALGPELAGKAIALGRYHGQDVDETLADPYGGRWGVSTGYDETGYWVEVRNASKVVHREVDPVKSPDPLTVGLAHGLNNRLDGPA